MKKPFVLVHGAWHGGWYWAEVARRLRDAGHLVHAPSLTGLAERAHLFGAQVTLATHVEDVVRLIEWEGLEGCVLVGHSYAGNVLSGVADRLRERVAHYVFLDAVVPHEGVSRWRWADYDTEADRQARLLAIAGAGAGVALAPPPAEVFGITDPALREWVGQRLTPMPAGTYLGELRFESGATTGLPRSYIGVTDPPFLRMHPVYDRVRDDPSWNWYTVRGGHDVMVTAPDALVELLVRIAG
jgi:pimeloyl-ACP methyl ester carboxylesterase